MDTEVLISVGPHKASSTLVVFDPVTRTPIDGARFANTTAGYRDLVRFAHRWRHRGDDIHIARQSRPSGRHLVGIGHPRHSPSLGRPAISRAEPSDRRQSGATGRRGRYAEGMEQHRIRITYCVP